MGTSHPAAVGAAFEQHPPSPQLAAMVRRDLRWAFAWPFGWLVGIGVNLVLSVLYLAWVPLTGGVHPDWAILIGTYFSLFVLADVTTTNLLGVDTAETRLRLLRGAPLVRILLAKNVALFIIVGVPTLVVTGLVTAYVEPEYRLVITLPGVVYPILTWLGIGNLISVLMPYEPLPLRTRWSERRAVRRLVYWLCCLGLPYLLCLVVDPMRVLPQAIGSASGLPNTDTVHGVETLVLGVVVWVAATTSSLVAARRWTIRFDDLR